MALSSTSAAMHTALATSLALVSHAHSQVLSPDEPMISACTAPAPAEAQPFSGIVLEVLDGRAICVAQGPTPDQWIRVRLATRAGRDGRAILMAACFAKRVTCKTKRLLNQGVAADCMIDGVSLTDILDRPDVVAEASEWR